MFKKITSIFTGVTVICWLSGLALLVPLPLNAVTVNEGDLIRGPDGIKVYIVNAYNYKRHIYNPDVFNIYEHLKWENIKEVDQATLDSYTISDLYRVDVEYQVYSVGEDGIKHWLNMTAAEFVTEGYSWNQVFIVNAEEGAYYTVGSDLIVEPVVPEGLTVALSDDTPAADSIPYGSSMEFFKFTLTADEDVNINSIKITAGGIGTYTHIDSVAIFDEDGVRLSSVKNISSEGDAIFNFSTPIEVVAGTPRTLTVKATIESGQSGELFNLGIAAASDIISNATAVSGTDVYGYLMTILGTGVGTSVITAAATQTNTHSFGEDDILAADFEVSATGEDLLFSGITFENGGTRDDDLISNLKLVCDGVELDTGELGNHEVSFSFSDYLIEDGDKAVCEVRGDLGVGTINNTIALYIEDTSDVNLTCSTSGFGAGITITSIDTPLEAQIITLTTGDFTIDFDKSATPNKDVRPDTDNVVLATLKVTSHGEDATIETIIDGGTASTQFEISGTTLTTGEITNVEMRDVDTGSIYDVEETIGTNRWSLELTEEISLVKNVTKTFEIRADLTGGSGATYPIDNGDTLKVILDSGAMTVTGDVSGDLIEDIVPSSITSAIATVETASLDVTTTTLNDESIVGGAEDVIMYQAALEAGDASLVSLKTVRITDKSEGGLFKDDYITKLDLYLDGVLMDSKSGSISETDHSITFSSLTTNNVIPASETVNLVLKGSFASTIGSGTVTLGITSTSTDVISRDVNNDLIVETITSATAVSRTLTLATVGTLKVDLLTTDTKANKDMYTVAGSSGPSGRYLGELVFTTTKEPVRVTELRLVENTASADTDDIASVSLVKENGDIVITQAVDSSGDVVLTNADLEFPADQSTSYFIVANTKGINVLNDPTSTASSGDTIQYYINYTNGVVAEGVDSGEDIVVSGIPTLKTSSTNEATWSTTQKTDGNYSVELKGDAGWSNAMIAYGETLETLVALTATKGSYTVLNAEFHVYGPSSGLVPFAVLYLDEDDDGTTDTVMVGGFDVDGSDGSVISIGQAWVDAYKTSEAKWMLQSYDDGTIGAYTGDYSGATSSVSLAEYLADTDCCAGARVTHVGYGTYGNTNASYVDDIVIGGVTYSMEASNIATILGGAVTWIENDMADGTLSSGAGKIIGKYKVSIDTGSNRNSDNTLMKVALKELIITTTYKISATTTTGIANFKAYIEGDTSNKTDGITFGNSAATGTLDLTTLDAKANEVDGEITIVVIGDIAALGEYSDYLQTEINALSTDFTYTDSITTSTDRTDKLTIDEVIGGILSQ